MKNYGKLILFAGLAFLAFSAGASASAAPPNANHDAALSASLDSVTLPVGLNYDDHVCVEFVADRVEFAEVEALLVVEQPTETRASLVQSQRSRDRLISQGANYRSSVSDEHAATRMWGRQCQHF